MGDTLYIKNIGEKEAEIFLYDLIGMGGINAQAFVNELQTLDRMGLDVINVRINSKGGDVVEGMGIFAAIQATKTPIDTYVDGVAASMAAVIAMAGRQRFISDFGQLMVHNPRPQKPGQLDEKTANAIEALRESLVTMLGNNANLNEDQVGELMDVETWINANEAKDKGLVDQVIVTARKHKEELKGKDTAAIAAYTGDVILNEIIEDFDKPKPSNMLNIINHLGLDKDSKEEAVLATIQEKENQLAEATETLEAATAEKEEAVTAKDQALEEATALKAELAEVAVGAAIKDGKVDKKDKEALVATAIENYAAFKTILTSVTAVPTSIIASLKGNGNGEGGPDPRADWTLRDWEKKDPKGLAIKKAEDPTWYKAEYEAEYINK